MTNKTNYDNEKTQYQCQNDESTRYDAPVNNNADTVEAVAAGEEKAGTAKTQPTWRMVATGTGTGILLGASAALFSSASPVEPQSGTESQDEGPDRTAQQPVWTDSEIQVASGVSDDMSFGQAFAAARAEVGSGGAFEWRGNIYSTYTAEEWNAMSAEQRNEFGNHFSYYSNASANTAHTAQATDEAGTVTAEAHGTAHHQETSGNGTGAANVSQTSGDEVDVVSAEESEVEILGVIHDSETGMNMGGMVIDGQEFVVVDVDGDGVFDVMGADINGDSQLSENEIADISNEGLTVNDLGGFSNPDAGQLYASNDAEPDYVNDADIYNV